MRHGETFWNTEGRLQGQIDIPLNDEGRRMAVSCGQGMKDVAVDLCISSPLCRATETAELVLAENAGYRDRGTEVLEALRTEWEKKPGSLPGEICIAGTKDVPYLTDSRLKEASFGPWEGLICKAEGYNVPLDDFSTYWKDPDSPQIPEDVERLTRVAERVRSAITDIMAWESLRDKTVLLVVHGCVMRSVMYLMSGGKYFHGKVPFNCEIIEAVPDGKEGLIELGRKIYYDKSMMHDYYATMKQE